MLYMLYLTSTKRSADEQRTYVHVILDEVIFFSFQLLVMYLDEQNEGGKSSFSIFFLSKGLSQELLTIYIRYYRASIYQTLGLYRDFFYTKTLTNDTLYASLSYWQTLCNGFLYKVLKKSSFKKSIRIESFLEFMLQVSKMCYFR